MNCPHCGYLMDPLETECAKCHGRGLWDPEQDVSLELPPEAIYVPSSLAVVSTAPRGMTQNQPVARSCPVCESVNVQKVSAVYEGGTDYTTSSGTSKGMTYGLGHVFGGGTAGMIGINNSKHETHHTTSSMLATKLAPPSAPATPSQPSAPVYQAPDSWGGFLGCWLWCLLPFDTITLLVCYVFGYRPAWGWLAFFLYAPVILTAIILLVVLVGFVNEVAVKAAARRKHRADLAVWNLGSAQAHTSWQQRCAQIKADGHTRKLNWERLYYCHQCDHVFDPETNRAVASSQMNAIL